MDYQKVFPSLHRSSLPHQEVIHFLQDHRLSLLEIDVYKRQVLVHYGGQSAKKSGLLDRVCEALKDFDIDYVTLGGVVPNPHLSKVYEGIELCKKEGVDFILAVGGGSVIDSCKAIAYGLGTVSYTHLNCKICSSN